MKTLSGLFIFLWSAIAYAAGPSFADFETTQFFNSNNRVFILDGGAATNLDLKWNLLASPSSQYVELKKLDAHTVALQYFSGAIQVYWHTHDNFFHFDFAPTLDYATTLSLPWVNGSGALVSLPNAAGSLTNDSNGNIGWYNLSPIIFTQTLGGSDANVNPIQGTTKYLSPFASPQNDGATTEANAWQVFYQKGYFTNFWISENGLLTGTNVTITLMTNSVASNIAVTIPGNAGATVYGVDLTHSPAFAGGSNNVSLRITANNPQTIQTRMNWTIQFVSQP